MAFPRLRVPSASRQMIDTFGGYNHNLRIGDGEFYNMKNMSSDDYPLLSTRKARGIYAEADKPAGLIAKDALCYVDGTKFVINKKEIDMRLNDKPKQLISMGAYVIIMPDKKYINTQDLTDFGNIEAFYPGVDGQTVTASYEMCRLDGTTYTGAIKSASPPEGPEGSDGPENMQLWIDISSTPHVLKQYSKTSATWIQIATTYVKISAPGIAAPFRQYDAVKISGFPTEDRQLAEMEGITYPLWEAYHDPGDEKTGRAEGTTDYVIIVGVLDEAVTYESNLRLERTMPIMDFVIESGNRLFGCRYGPAANGEVVNEIYASKLGDFRNWNCMMQVSTDSWVASLGTDGLFTGAITHMGYPLFFKENCVHKVYGNFPANFQIQTTACRGVQKGCDRSLAIVNETLYYKARSGVCAYDGSLPTEVSYALGNEAYRYAVGGSHGNKYYISMADNLGVYHLFVFDTAKGMWHREDNLRADCFCSCGDELYCIENGSGNILTMLGSGQACMEPIEWMVETGMVGLSMPDRKYISRLNLRLMLPEHSQLSCYAEYDSSGHWEYLFTIAGQGTRAFALPIRPKRCDHMKLRFEGLGMAKIYSITKTIEQGSDLL